MGKDEKEKGQLVTCEKCGHKWMYKGESIRPNCSSCNRRVKKAIDR
jgi:DNA-directed RNA polymerase subunit RPC12/RpoP